MEEFGLFVIVAASIFSFEMGGRAERNAAKQRELAQGVAILHSVFQVVAVVEGTEARDRIVEWLNKQSRKSSGTS